jgi:hypothetical protein
MRVRDLHESAAAPDDGQHRRDSDRIAALLEEVRGMAGPSTWARVEELVQRLVALYGEGLARILELVPDDGCPIGPAAVERLAADELVSSLLRLHGLHPVPLEERVRRALEAIQGRLGGATVVLAALEPDGAARLRVDADRACGLSSAALGRAIEQAVIDAAPEVSRVVVEGLAPPPPADRLVTLKLPRADAGARG